MTEMHGSVCIIIYTGIYPRRDCMTTMLETQKPLGIYMPCLVMCAYIAVTYLLVEW